MRGVFIRIEYEAQQGFTIDCREARIDSEHPLRPRTVVKSVKT